MTFLSRRVRTLLGIGAAALAVVTFVPGHASGTSPHSSVSPAPQNDPAIAIGTAEEPYFRLNDAVRALNAGIAGSPLAGTRIDMDNKRFYVYWVGAVPPALSSLMGQAASSGITLVVRAAASTERQTADAAARIGKWAESTGAKVTVQLSSDGSGLVVQYPTGADPNSGYAPATQAASDSAMQTAVQNEMREVQSSTGVRVVAGNVVAHRGTPLDRLSDVSPFWAGGLLTEFDGDRCTNGFSMYAANGARFMLTAAHCSRYFDGKDVRVGGETSPVVGSTDFIHEIYDLSPSYEMGVIRLTPPKTNAGKMYTQRYAGVPIAGYAGNGIPPGGQYCVSAAFGIPNCNIRSAEQLLDCGSYSRCAYVIHVVSTAGAIICAGDSGGPIYFHNSAGYIAAGVVSAGYTGGPCYQDGSVSVVVSAMRKVPGLLLVTG